jgi:hypothetical protein
MYESIKNAVALLARSPVRNCSLLPPTTRCPGCSGQLRTHLTPHARPSGGMLAQAAVALPDESPEINAVRRAKESGCVIVNGWHLS